MNHNNKVKTWFLEFLSENELNSSNGAIRTPQGGDQEPNRLQKFSAEIREPAGRTTILVSLHQSGVCGACGVFRLKKL